MENCIFCKIVADEIPSSKIYEDGKILAILDINPVNPGHVLVLPKIHAENFETISDSDLQAAILAVKRLGLSIKTALGYEGYNVIENNDLVAGQLIPHLHFHIVPRKENDDLRPWPQGKYAEGEMARIAEKIKQAL